MPALKAQDSRPDFALRFSVGCGRPGDVNGGYEMKKAKAGMGAGVLILVACAAAGCSRGNGDSGAVSGSPAGGVGLAGSDRAYAGERRSGGGYAEQDRGPVPMFHGEPMWSENRSHSAKENAEYHFERAGADLGSRTLDDFLTKVHRFGDHPPPGTQKLTRPNGDRLLYDPKANLFAVFTSQGAPRTVFKPSDGTAYWAEQKQRMASGDDGYRRRSYGGGGGYGRGGEGGSGGGDQGQ